MRRLRDKLKAIWHILIDEEHIVFTLYKKQSDKNTFRCRISNRAKVGFINAAENVLKSLREGTYNNKINNQ